MVDDKLVGSKKPAPAGRKARRVRPGGKDTTLTERQKLLRKKGGEALASLRFNASLSQAELATKIGWPTPSMVSMVEGGSTAFPLNKVGELARALGVEEATLAELILRFYEPELHKAIYGK